MTYKIYAGYTKGGLILSIEATATTKDEALARLGYYIGLLRGLGYKAEHVSVRRGQEEITLPPYVALALDWIW